MALHRYVPSEIYVMHSYDSQDLLRSLFINMFTLILLVGDVVRSGDSEHDSRVNPGYRHREPTCRELQGHSRRGRALFGSFSWGLRRPL